MVLKMELRVAQRCVCCEQLIDVQQQVASIIAVTMFGSVNPYVLCPCCLQETTLEMQENPEFQRRARVEMYQRYGVVIRKRWAPTSLELPENTRAGKPAQGRRKYDDDRD